MAQIRRLFDPAIFGGAAVFDAARLPGPNVRRLFDPRIFDPLVFDARPFVVDIDAELVAKLAADPILAGYCPDGVFIDVAPQGATRFVLVRDVTAENAGQFGGRALEVTDYTIEAIARTTSDVPLDLAAMRIDTLLEDQTLDLRPSVFGALYRTERLRRVLPDARDLTVRWGRRGGIYRVEASVPDPGTVAPAPDPPKAPIALNASQIEDAIAAVLAADVDLPMMLPDGVWIDDAPPGANRFINISVVRAVDVPRFGGRAIEDVQLRIDAVSSSKPQADVGTAADRIDDVLEDRFLTIPGYTWMTLHREYRTRWKVPDDTDPALLWSERGGLYRVQVSTPEAVLAA